MESDQTAQENSPWHAGEIALQNTVGAVARMDMMGRKFLRDHLIEQHRDFYEQLPFAVFGTVDADDMVWASPRAGLPGFLTAPDPTHLHVDAWLDPADPASAGLAPGRGVAMIGIEPWTRRRNRVNGRIERADDGGFTIAVEESFGNCPQYIQRRAPQFTRDPAMPSPAAPDRLGALDDAARTLITITDSFYVASYADTATGRRVDVSHRGGRPGFLRVDEQGVITIPDFAGNQFFNTLGNIHQTGKAGVVFIDWTSGDLLQISGDAEVVLESPEIAAFTGAQRLWRLRPRAILRRPAGLPLTWQFTDDPWSPALARTGTWAEAQARLDASGSGEGG
ncbi:MAG: pyridoxamine 5'-phosphate oxidase family protein [Sphingomonadales bacterium]|nr:pyridoxamine 5'-phosphate oxidase family protein [Sphingomonadales bacterium]